MRSQVAQGAARQVLTIWIAVLLSMAGISATQAAEDEPLRLGVVTFLSGPGAGPFGIPAANAAELVIAAINAGTMPAPYDSKGIAGRTVMPEVIDEAGGVTKQVTEFRNLVQRRNVDAVVGYVSSGSCLGIAPVAEELQTLTVFFDCGTPRIFEENDYHYVFRTAAHAAMDSVGAARYLLDRFPDTRSYAGINQNYAWGQDSWRDFAAAMKVLAPDSEVATEQFPKLFAGQYGSEISALAVSGADAVHSSLWGPDLESFLFQAAARGLPQDSVLVLSCGETTMFNLGANLPDGMIIGARGPYGVMAEPTPLNEWFRAEYEKRFGTSPTYPAYHMAQAILGLKAAADKAADAAGAPPDKEQIISAFENLEYEAFGANIRMSLGKGHQAVTGIAYGLTKYDHDKDQPGIVDIIRYDADCVNPPPGMHSVDWIEQGMPGAKCE
ncbi:MAG: ABC transporter substrate-binding protein [Rhodospirillaceae bacterium]|nr:ABC transporter substrate-binding protein [Rhodospirillaceae bacterium]